MKSTSSLWNGRYNWTSRDNEISHTGEDAWFPFLTILLA